MLFIKTVFGNTRHELHCTVGQYADISQNDCSSKVSPYITFGRHKVTDDWTNLFLVKFWPVLKKRTFFLARKLTKLEHFLEISQYFMRKSLKSVTKIFEMVLIHKRGLKPTNKYIISHVSILLFMTLCPLFLAQCAVLYQCFTSV